MGLCKCPKRKVTNLFCFEHRVNVCEGCLLSNHESCVVQTYLSWLTDSDYDANCLLCFEALNSKETVRLKCLHLFHWDCFNVRAHQLPNTTAPAGYKCPSCLECIFPSENQSSPVVDKLRDKLQTVNWGRLGLGLPSVPELEQKILLSAQLSTMSANSHTNHQQSHHPIVHHSVANNIPPSEKPMHIPSHEDPFEMNTFTARSKLLPSEGNGNVSSSVFMGNEDDSKYTKKTVERNLRVRFARMPRSVKRLLMAVFTLVLLYCFFHAFFGDSQHEAGQRDEDPLLFDPHANPNIRVQRDNRGES